MTRLAPQSVGSMPIEYFLSSAVSRTLGAQAYMPCGADGTATFGLVPTHGGAAAAAIDAGGPLASDVATGTTTVCAGLPLSVIGMREQPIGRSSNKPSKATVAE